FAFSCFANYCLSNGSFLPCSLTITISSPKIEAVCNCFIALSFIHVIESSSFVPSTLSFVSTPFSTGDCSTSFSVFSLGDCLVSFLSGSVLVFCLFVSDLSDLDFFVPEAVSFVPLDVFVSFCFTSSFSETTSLSLGFLVFVSFFASFSFCFPFVLGFSFFSSTTSFPSTFFLVSVFTGVVTFE